MTYKNKKSFLVDVAFWAAIILIIYFVLNYVFKWIAPFIVGLIIATVLRPVTSFFVKNASSSKRGVSLAVTAIFYVAVGVLVWLLLAFIISKVTLLIQATPKFYEENLQPALLSLTDWLSSSVENLSHDTAQYMTTVANEVIAKLASTLTGLSGKIVSSATSFVVNIPMMIITVIFTIASSLFISLDYNLVVEKLALFLPEKSDTIVKEARGFITGALFRMLRSYILIFLITFAELSLCFLIIGQNNAITIAVIIAALDILPFLGTGGVLLPWAVISFITSDMTKGIELIVIYLVVTIIRNIIEPRIVGKSIGMHPLVSITSMFAGLKMAGFWGMIGLPILIMFGKYLHTKGIITFRPFSQSVNDEEETQVIE